MDIKNELINGSSIYDLSLRVVYYARVSTVSEEQMTSIVNQVDYFVNYIKSYNKWILVDGYVDEGISGKGVSKRDNFIKMINDSKSRKFDLVLTKSVSRFARNTIDSIYYTNLLLDRGIGVIFINDNINTFYPDSEFRLTLMASIAQDELRKLSESVRFGLRQSINRGVVLGNDNILGYYKDNGRLIVIEKEAIIVREIFDLFIRGVHNYSEIARIVNKKHNRKFNSMSIKRILTNYKYKGYYCGKKSEVIDYKKGNRRNINSDNWIIYRDYGKVPPIVSEDVWDIVNGIIEVKKNTYIDKYKNKVYCSKHGKVISKRKKYKDKYYYYYICCDCFKVSSILLDKILIEIDISKILISKVDNVFKIDILK